MSIGDLRYGLATFVADTCDIPNRYAAVPRAPVRPCVIVTPDPDEYLAPGDVYCSWLGTWRALIIAESEQPDEAFDEIDGYLDALLVAESQWSPALVLGPQIWNLAGGVYIGAALTYQLRFTATTEE